MTIEKIFEQASVTPAKSAVVYNGVSHSYADFARRIDAARGYLSRLNVSPGSVGILCIENLLEAWTVGMALRSLGVTTVAARDAGEGAKLGLRNASCIVALENERPELLAGVPSGAQWQVIRVPASLQSPAGSTATPNAIESAIPPGGHIMLTSGTTGGYKKILREVGSEARAIPGHADLYGITASSTVYVMNFGLWTAGGHRWPSITWGMGGTVIMHQWPDLYRPLIQHQVTHIFATPAMLPGLMQAPKGVELRNDATRLLVTGGALSNALLEAAQQRLTRQVFSLLASTEASILGITLLEQPDDLLWHRVDPSRGVQVVDEAGNVLGPGQEGLVRSRTLEGITGYLDDEKTTREFFRDGYFYPGDLGMFGDDGRLSMRGRAVDVINILGDKIATAPLERALQDRLNAQGVCILTLEDAEAVDAVYIVIESSRSLDQKDIVAAAQAELALIMGVPMHFCLFEKLPRNDMGKIQRSVLKQQLRALLAASTTAPQ